MVLDSVYNKVAIYHVPSQREQDMRGLPEKLRLIDEHFLTHPTEGSQKVTDCLGARLVGEANTVKKYITSLRKFPDTHRGAAAVPKFDTYLGFTEAKLDYKRIDEYWANDFLASAYTVIQRLNMQGSATGTSVYFAREQLLTNPMSCLSLRRDNPWSREEIMNHICARTFEERDRIVAKGILTKQDGEAHGLKKLNHKQLLAAASKANDDSPIENDIGHYRIYVLLDAANGWAKVGQSLDVDTWHAGQNATMPVEVYEPICNFVTHPDMERYCHEYLKEDKVNPEKDRNEWFFITKTLIDMIRELEKREILCFDNVTKPKYESMMAKVEAIYHERNKEFIDHSQQMSQSFIRRQNMSGRWSYYSQASQEPEISIVAKYYPNTWVWNGPDLPLCVEEQPTQPL